MDVLNVDVGKRFSTGCPNFERSNWKLSLTEKLQEVPPTFRRCLHGCGLVKPGFRPSAFVRRCPRTLHDFKYFLPFKDVGV